MYPSRQSPLFKCEPHTHPYSYHRDWLSSAFSDWSELFTRLLSTASLYSLRLAGLDLIWPFDWLWEAWFWVEMWLGIGRGCVLFVTGGPLMLLTRVGFRDRKGRFLPADSLKMESMNTDSTVKEGPRKDSRVERSGSSELWQGKLSDLGMGVLVVRGPFRLVLLGWYSLGVGWERTPALVDVTGGATSTDTGCRLSFESRSWMLVRRVVPSAVEMTLLARGSVEEAESRRSETDVALACEDRLERIGTEPLTRVLSALRRVGRPGCPVDLGGRSQLTAAAFPLEERNIPRPLVVRSFGPCSEDVERRGESTVRFSWLPDYRTQTRQTLSGTGPWQTFLSFSSLFYFKNVNVQIEFNIPFDLFHLQLLIKQINNSKQFSLELRPHLCRINTLVQELLQWEHLAAPVLVLSGAPCGGGWVEGPAQLQGALMGGARRGGLLDGAAAAAGPHLLIQTEAELSAALAVRPAEAAVQRACGKEGSENVEKVIYDLYRSLLGSAVIFRIFFLCCLHFYTIFN